MEQCRAKMAHGDPRWTALEYFEGCMAAKDYHLASNNRCMDTHNLDDPVSPMPVAIREPDCWAWGPTNWP